MDSESPAVVRIAGQETDSSGEAFLTATWRPLGRKSATPGTAPDGDADALRVRAHRRSAAGEAV